MVILGLLAILLSTKGIRNRRNMHGRTLDIVPPAPFLFAIVNP